MFNRNQNHLSSKSHAHTKNSCSPCEYYQPCAAPPPPQPCVVERIKKVPTEVAVPYVQVERVPEPYPVKEIQQVPRDVHVDRIVKVREEVPVPVPEIIRVPEPYAVKEVIRVPEPYPVKEIVEVPVVQERIVEKPVYVPVQAPCRPAPAAPTCGCGCGSPAGYCSSIRDRR